MSKQKSQPILVFDSSHKLCALVSNLSFISKISGRTNMSFRNAIKGISKTSHDCYFRYLDSSIEITDEDIGALSIEEYDSMIGREPDYYPPFKYKTQKQKIKCKK